MQASLLTFVFFPFSLITSNSDIGSLSFRPPGWEGNYWISNIFREEDIQAFKSLGRADMRTEKMDGNEL